MADNLLTVIKDKSMDQAKENKLEETLAERGLRYGTFADNATISQKLEAVLQSGVEYGILHPVHREALKVICQKMSRIVSGGDPYYADNWHDIAGYAKLAEDFTGQKKDERQRKHNEGLDRNPRQYYQFTGTHPIGSGSIDAGRADSQVSAGID